MERYETNAKNEFADNYFQCEEFLARNHAKGGFPFTILRGGNYFGPRENVLRMFFLLQWMQGHQELQIPLHQYTGDNRFSPTYTVDMAKAV